MRPLGVLQVSLKKWNFTSLRFLYLSTKYIFSSSTLNRCFYLSIASDSFITLYDPIFLLWVGSDQVMDYYTTEREFVVGVVRTRQNLHAAAGESDDTVGYYASDGRTHDACEKRLTRATQITEGNMP